MARVARQIPGLRSLGILGFPQALHTIKKANMALGAINLDSFAIRFYSSNLINCAR
jgi:hypothetical protein